MKYINKIFCLFMMLILTVSSNVYANSRNIEFGDDVFNLVATFCVNETWLVSKLLL